MRRSSFGRVTLGLKLGAVIVSCVAATIALAAMAFVEESATFARDQARRLAVEAAAGSADKVSRKLADDFGAVLVASNGLAALRGAGIDDPRASAAIILHLMAGGASQQAAWLVWKPPVDGTVGAPLDRMPQADAMRRWTRVPSQRPTESAQVAALDLPIYRAPLIDGQAFVSEPYYLMDGDGGHATVVSYAEPIMTGGKLAGALGIDVAVEPLQRSIAALPRPKGSSLTLASNEGTVVATTRPELGDMSLQETKTGLASAFAAARKAGRFEALVTLGGTTYVRTIQPITFSSVKAPWYVVADTPVQAFLGTGGEGSLWKLWAAVIALLGLLALILLAIGFIVTRPLKKIEAYIQTLGADGSSVAILDTGRSDEIGSIAKALLAFKTSAGEIEKLKASKAADEMHNAAARRGELKAVADALAQSVQRIAGVVEGNAAGIMRRAQAMAAATDESAERAKVIVDASAAAGSSVNAVQDAARDLRRSIQQITSEAQNAKEIASSAAIQARGSTAVTSELAAKASEIGAVVETISTIAQRTNLLALNATIEAARSGEAGRGFAVVAQEVKALAGQTAAATAQIALQIDAMQKTAADAGEVLALIGGTIERIDEISATISGAVTLQGEATESISGFVSTAVAATRHVDEAIEDVEKCTGDVGRAAAEMLHEIASLTDVSRQLNEQVSDAINRIRGAQAAEATLRPRADGRPAA